MRRSISALAALALATALLGVAAPAEAAGYPSTLHAGHAMRPGSRLVSANGHYRGAVERDGRLVVRTAAGHGVWSTPKTGAAATLYLGRTGQLAVQVNHKPRWETHTSGSGSADVLTMRNDGVLALSSRGVLVWSSSIGNGCRHTGGRTLVVSISRQLARMCAGGEQIRTTRVTTGASALGDGTPTGTWHVQAKVRDTTLYPAAGGAYPVKYWVPYDGAYGLHDSPWQKFPYGSSLYRTRGSHGCVHVPGTTMAWLFGWLRIGTTVTVRA